jgi:inner membrane protein
MPTIITHAFVGAASSRLLPSPPTSVLVLASVCALIPDADVISFKLGISYGADFGHRGFSHSVLFAMILGALVGWGMHRFSQQPKIGWIKWAAFFSLVTVSHSLLDAFTDGGLGVAFLWPFDNARYFAPFRPIKVAPIALSRFFSSSVVPVLVSELVWVWLPMMALVLIRRWKKRDAKEVAT